MKTTVMFFTNQIVCKTQKAVLVRLPDTNYCVWLPLKLTRIMESGTFEALIFEDMSFGIYFQKKRLCDVTYDEVQSLFNFNSNAARNSVWRLIKKRAKNEGNMVDKQEVHHIPKRIKPVKRSVDDEFKR